MDRLLAWPKEYKMAQANTRSSGKTTKHPHGNMRKILVKDFYRSITLEKLKETVEGRNMCEHFAMLEFSALKDLFHKSDYLELGQQSCILRIYKHCRIEWQKPK